MLAGLRPRLGVVVPVDSTGDVDVESDAVLFVVESIVLTDSVLVPEDPAVGVFSRAVFVDFGSEEVEGMETGEGDREVFHGLRVRFANDDLEKALRGRSADTLGAAVTSTLGLMLAEGKGVSLLLLLSVVVVLLILSVGGCVLRTGRLPAFSLSEACRRILFPVSTSICCVGDCASAAS